MMRGAVVVLLGLLVSVAIGGEVDWRDVRARATRPRWRRADDVVAGWRWEGGCRPRYAPSLGHHAVTLMSGEHLDVRLEPGEGLWLREAARPIEPAEVDLEISEDGELWTPARWRADAPSRSLRYVPRGWRRVLLRVRRPLEGPARPEPLELGVFISRPARVLEEGAWLERPPARGESVQVWERGEPLPRPFHRAGPGRHLGLDVGSLERLRLVLLLEYEPTASRGRRRFEARLAGPGGWRRSVTLHTDVDTRDRWTVDGRPRALGHARVVTFDDLPPDGVVTVSCDSLILCRALGVPRRAWLLPRWNRPDLLTGAELDGWKRRAREVEQELISTLARGWPDLTGSSEPLEMAARVATRNDLRHGDLAAVALARSLSARWGEPPELARHASRLETWHGRWREVLPRCAEGGLDPLHGRFVTRSLSDEEDLPDRRIVPERMLDDLWGGVASGSFLTVPAGEPAAAVYPLPGMPWPSAVRIAVLRPGWDSTAGERRLFTRVDEGPVEEWILRPTEAALRAPSRPGELALALSAADGGRSAAGPDGWRRGAGPLVDVATGEFVIPARARAVRVWRGGPPERTVRVCVHYRGTDGFELDEQSCLEAARVVDSGSGVWIWFRSALRLEGREAVAATRAEAALRNHWAGVLRAVATARHRLAPRGPTSVDTAVDGASPSRSAPGEDAWRAERAGRLEDALTLWTRGLEAPDAASREAARQGQVRVLCSLGQWSLATDLLEQTLVDDPDGLGGWALAELESIHLRDRDADGWSRLWCSLLAHRLRPQDGRELASAWLDEGDFGSALQLALALPAGERHLETVLRAALRERWWATFDAAIRQLPDPADRALWEAHELAARGRATEALRRLGSAGPRGMEWSDVLREGLRIRRSLASADPGVRGRAILAWETWSAGIPGPRVRVVEPGLVTGAAGAVAIQEAVRGRRMVWWRAEPGHPVTLEVLGPVELRVEARALLAADAEVESEDWIRIRVGECLRRVPMDVIPATSLCVEGAETGLDGSPAPTVGRGLDIDWSLGPGLHRVEVSAERIEIIVRALTTRPELAPSLLPPWSVAAVRAAWRGGSSDPRGTGSAGPGTRVRVLSRSGGARSRERTVALPATGWPPSAEIPATIDASLALRLSLRLGTWREGVGRFGGTGAALERLDGGEREHLFMALGPDASSSAPPSVGPSPEVRDALDRAAGRLESLLRRAPASEDPAAALERVRDLLWISERDPGLREEARVRGVELAHRFRSEPEMRPLSLRLRRGWGWERVRSVAGGAGSRFLRVSGWAPQSPELLVRRALAPNLRQHERLLASGESVGLSVTAREGKSLRLRLASFHAITRGTGPIVASVRVDDEPSRTVRLSVSVPEVNVPVVLPPGSHRVEIAVLASQRRCFLRVGLHEADGEDSPEDPGRPWVEERDREYHVATHDRPVRVELEGPAWVRVDERRGNVTLRSYRRLESGVPPLELRPPAGEGETLFRVFRRGDEGADEEDAGSREADTRSDALEREERIPALPSVPGDPPALSSRSVDDPEIVPGDRGLGTGTWSFGARFRRRRALEEDEVGRLKPDEHFELSATYRTRVAGEGLWSRTDVLGRVSIDGGPGWGLRQRLYLEPEGWWGLTFRIDGRLHSQWPMGDGLDPRGDPELSAAGAFELRQRQRLHPRWTHRPHVGVFGRTFTIDEGSAAALRVTDQDVFTTYKSRHRAGWYLGDRLTWAPWADTRVDFRASLTANEDFDPLSPDHVDLGVAAIQRVGWMEVEAGYGWRRFFADADRGADVDRHVITLAGSADLWTHRGRRVEIEGRWAYDVGNADSAFLVALVWHLGDLSGYRDFGPDELRMRGLREHSMLTALERRGP